MFGVPVIVNSGDRFQGMSLDKRIDMAVEKSRQLVDLIHEIERIHANNCYLTYSTVLRCELKSTHAGNAFHFLRLSSFGYEVTRLIALWDNASKDRVSIPSLAQIIDNVEVKRELKVRSISLYEHDDTMLGQPAAINRFERAYKVATLLPKLALCSHRLKTLRGYRDKWLAHNLDTKTLTPKYGFERKMRLTSHRAANALTAVISNSGFDFLSTVGICQQHADELWKGLSWSRQA